MRENFVKIKKTDIERLISLISEIWPEVFTEIIGKEQVDYMLRNYQGKENICNEIENGRNYYFIQNKGETIGYFAYDIYETHLLLSKVYLHKSMRGKGFSKEVFRFLKEESQKHSIHSIQLFVNRFNFSSISIYKKIGFEIIESLDTALNEKFVLNDYRMQWNF